MHRINGSFDRNVVDIGFIILFWLLAIWYKKKGNLKAASASDRVIKNIRYDILLRLILVVVTVLIIILAIIFNSNSLPRIVARVMIDVQGKQYQAAEAELSKALSDETFNNNTDSAFLLLMRGDVYMSETKYDLAIQDFDKAISLHPKNEAKIIVERGEAKFFSGSFASSAEDLKVEVNKDDPNAIYRIIWLHLAHIHANQDDKVEFDQNSASLLTDKWPAPIVNLYSGRGTIQNVSAKAMIGDAKAQLGQTCEANYYLGEYYLMQKQMDIAKQVFQAAAEHCPDDFGEKHAAIMEIKLNGW